MRKSHHLIRVVMKCTICLAFILSCHDANALYIEHNYSYPHSDSYAGGGYFQIYHFEPAGQSFYATDANIGTIGLYVTDLTTNELYPYAENLPLNLSIYEGAGVHGSLLSTMTSTTLNEGFTGYVDFDVSSVDFISGRTYSAVLTAANNRWGIPVQDHGMIGPQGTLIPNYEGGDLILGGELQFWSDAVFRILPNEQPREPRTYSLFIGMDDENINGSATVGKIYSAFLQNDIIQEEFAYVLKNENATKNNISLILDNLNLNENDQFIFYYFGHGGTYKTKIGFESTLSSGDEFLAIGTTADDYLSDDDLTMMFQNEKWANVEKWFILDTCKSAGFWGNNDPSDSGDLEKLDNVALFAAASEDWYAASTFVDSTGVFTNGWVAGLELNDGWAKADSNRDQQVSFEEWNLWLQQIDNWYDWRYNPYVYEQEVGDIHYIDSPEFFQPFIAKSEDFQGTFDMASSTVPEPSTMLLFGSGLAGFAFLARRKRS